MVEAAYVASKSLHRRCATFHGAVFEVAVANRMLRTDILCFRDVTIAGHPRFEFTKKDHEHA
jgi:hypothetical protein